MFQVILLAKIAVTFQAMVSQSTKVVKLKRQIFFWMLLSGQFTEFTTDQTMMEGVLDYFCGLSEERKQEFINCPQIQEMLRFFLIS